MSLCSNSLFQEVENVVTYAQITSKPDDSYCTRVASISPCYCTNDLNLLLLLFDETNALACSQMSFQNVDRCFVFLDFGGDFEDEVFADEVGDDAGLLIGRHCCVISGCDAEERFSMLGVRDSLHNRIICGVKEFTNESERYCGRYTGLMCCKFCNGENDGVRRRHAVSEIACSG